MIASAASRLSPRLARRIDDGQPREIGVFRIVGSDWMVFRLVDKLFNTRSWFYFAIRERRTEDGWELNVAVVPKPPWKDWHEPSVSLCQAWRRMLLKRIER